MPSCACGLRTGRMRRTPVAAPASGSRSARSTTHVSSASGAPPATPQRSAYVDAKVGGGVTTAVLLAARAGMRHNLSGSSYFTVPPCTTFVLRVRGGRVSGCRWPRAILR
ncbi:hypothetical protein EON67_10250 [archaeon]|nr:MAG: hypothetical protein EON67_10250 [archaeon]